MGKIKEQMIEKENDFITSIQKLEENTKKLECQDFDEDIDLNGIKGILSEIVKLVKEIKEIKK